MIASFGGASALRRSLESLKPQFELAEVIVATNLDRETVDNLRLKFPTVQFVDARGEATVFELRALGVDHAQGEMIVMTEDHCTFSAGWIDAMRGVISQGRSVAGGPVDSPTHPGVTTWAVYLCEYAGFLPPMASAPASVLSAVNAAYPREALEACRDVWREGFFDNEVHDALRDDGYQFEIAGEAGVRSGLEMTLRQAAAHLFSGGGRFGGYRSRGAPVWKRTFWLLAMPIVPFLLMARIGRSVMTRRPAACGRTILASPWILALTIAWVLGESVGYMKSRPAEQRTTLGEGLTHANRN